jgi:hypothetical protein
LHLLEAADCSFCIGTAFDYLDDSGGLIGPNIVADESVASGEFVSSQAGSLVRKYLIFRKARLKAAPFLCS